MNLSKETVIAMENVKKLYQTGNTGYWALQGINFQVKPGEFIAVLGKSGSGKSTLLNLLGGIDQPTEGRININGKEIQKMSESRLSRMRGENIGFVFQFFQLMPTLTAFENVKLPMDFSKKIPQSEKNERVKQLLIKVNLLNHASKFPYELSGGEQQRVAIARALSNDPQIILADEPTGNLDSRTAEDIFGLLESLVSEGKTVIMVTHNQELALRCKRVIRIRDGLIVEDYYTVNERG